MTRARPDLANYITGDYGTSPKRGKGNPYANLQATTGFMGQHWDSGDIAFRPETWAALAALLHPGAFVFAFAGCRGYHRMACAMEDAGLIIHPAIGWLFGSGMAEKYTRERPINQLNWAIAALLFQNCWG
ncbi:MAG: hypothetical protein JO166_24695 [Deltaproteobacteria bacterium]|nr:hypothetical protein [Deltaproteobacteria bacterium]